MKKLFVKIFSKFNNMLSFEKGIDITDDYQVLKRKNIVIKNIIFLSNITYTLVLLFISLFDTSNRGNWVLTIIFVPVTFGLNRTLSKLINEQSHDKTKQQIAMYIAAFYMILSSVLIYFKIKTQMFDGSILNSKLNIGEAGYILIYYSLLVISLYQDKKMLISISKWMIIIITIIHFTITYMIFNEEYAYSLVEFFKNFFTSSAFIDILLRTLFLILYLVVLIANVGIAQYAYLERKNEAVKRQGVQTDYSDVVNDLFSVILGMRTVSGNDKEHIDMISALSSDLGRSMKLSNVELDELKKYVSIHIEERKNLVVLRKENMSEEDYEEVRRRSEIGARVAKRLQLEQKCEDIIRTHIEGAPTKSFKNEMNNMLMDIESQIVLICDCYVTMREAKSYKRPYSHKLTIDFMNHELMDYFNEDVFDKFMKNSDKIEELYNNSI
jgi:HD-GYP domain-containing protein (c-di-GMP phosphodiesterase class II)